MSDEGYQVYTQGSVKVEIFHREVPDLQNKMTPVNEVRVTLFSTIGLLNLEEMKKSLGDIVDVALESAPSVSEAKLPSHGVSDTYDGNDFSKKGKPSRSSKAEDM